MSARKYLPLVIGLAVAGYGCDTREPVPQAGWLPQVFVNATNANIHDVDLYAMQNGARLRIARLWSGESGEVEIGPPLVEAGSIVLEAYAMGVDQSYRTSPIEITGRTYIHFHIEQSLDSSTFSVTYGEELDSVSTTGETS